MLPWILCALLAVLVVGLLIKNFLLSMAMDEIADQFQARAAGYSNNLIFLSSRDRQARRLAAQLNEELRQLRQARQRYLEGDRELKEAVTNLSHDLRTPLTAICGYLELLEQEERSPQVEAYLAQVANRVEAMKALTEELFRYTLVAASGGLERKEVSVGQVLEESLVAHYGALTQRGIVPVLELTDEPVRRTLDPEALGRVFANLLSNVLKYSGGDLSVTLTAQGECTFSNSAPGLTPVQAARLFDRFYTVETGRSATGLGLAIAKHLTQEMGGTITADCREERLTVTLFFPPEKR